MGWVTDRLEAGIKWRYVGCFVRLFVARWYLPDNDSVALKVRYVVHDAHVSCYLL
jgi:hypothetical protein